MLRFYGGVVEETDAIKISKKSLSMDQHIWNNWKDMLKECEQTDCFQYMVPVRNADGEVIAYGYQDDEADRELRMLRELRENKDSLHFTSIFPECNEVIIYGCNELAVASAEYLETMGIRVITRGNYWKNFGMRADNESVRIDGGRRMVLYAEGSLTWDNNLYEIMRSSVSPEFECIDKIYEANVMTGRIRDTVCEFSELVHRLKDEREIAIIGDDRDAQDVYDLLVGQGIDICCFAVKEKGKDRLLGRKVMKITDVMCCFQKPVFINCRDRHGAFGNEETEYFDYRGYGRNKQFFFIKDYVEVSCSNLVHVLRGKNVVLTGDQILSKMLADYLELVEDGEVNVRYISLGEAVSVEKDDILCLIIPDYYNHDRELRRNSLNKKLFNMGFIDYTEYFICSRSFALIDLYLKRNKEKYTLSELIPKGILLGRIPGWSGNYFFRGIMDGHPEVLMIPLYCDFNVNLFYYCIRLAELDSEYILSAFWEMYEEEAYAAEKDFAGRQSFNSSMQRILKLKNSFTSQELFVMFHIAYMEMINGRQISDLGKYVIYWEPHFLSRNEFPFFALWLEDKEINGQTIVLRRNNIVRTGSACARSEKNRMAINAFKTMFLDEQIWDGVPIQYHFWSEFVMRFEDIKLRPREKTAEVCERLGIRWSDNMLRTTCADKPLEYRGSVDFDLKPVFNQYEKYLSEFDRFRISVASGPYQKKYGFPYEDCLRFSRKELQELYMKPFRFDEEAGDYDDNISIYKWLRWQLWELRKHMIVDKTSPQFGSLELEQTGKTCMVQYNRRELEKTLEYIRTHDRLILYGTGKDCLGLLKYVGTVKDKFLYSDKRAEKQPYVFQGKDVIAPEQLCGAYADYNILVTSSFCRRDIEYEFKRMGIDGARVFYNKAEYDGEK